MRWRADPLPHGEGSGHRALTPPLSTRPGRQASPGRRPVIGDQVHQRRVYINDQGLVVNDCHAEIVARRALVHFLYAQLELHLR